MCPSADKAPSLSSLIDAHRASDSLLTTLFYERAASTLSTDAKQSGERPWSSRPVAAALTFGLYFNHSIQLA